MQKIPRQQTAKDFPGNTPQDAAYSVMSTDNVGNMETESNSQKWSDYHEMPKTSSTTFANPEQL